MSEPSSSSNTPKAIGSLAKKQSDVTRQGATKLKFVPTLPQRRKKDVQPITTNNNPREVKAEPAPAAVPAESSERGRGRGRGRGDGRGRGRGRGGPPVVEMTASGPFAMGPAMAGSSSARRATPRSNFVPSVAAGGSGGSTPSSFGANLSNSAPPGLRNELRGPATTGVVKTEEDEEVYSDPDDGVEIIDMDNVRQMDWMAPENLKKERQPTKKLRVKEEQVEDAVMEEVDTRNAVNLEESEDEDELEDIIEDFATQTIEEENADSALREDRLFFFQFPAPFPKFMSKNVAAMDVDTAALAPAGDAAGKKVSFAADVKPDVASLSSRTPSVVPSEEAKEAVPVDGVIGQLEVYKSGAVKIRLANGILLDVSAATQPSFLQQAVLLDQTNGQLTVLGEVNKQFVVSPNVDALLEALDNDDDSTSLPGIVGGGLITMD
ncbi:hypothetical protein D9619_006187 [Psilocybe cf. subviscida]|uniref:DNA-directed RNA polymerase III subunit RPC4 n=1 Tax=Psilocybe cf. subviscida TaxID=2480587 RepID=A0A8H5B628_9AGAR|nr:hypothetical protein D9619_006187 [Psilocybe cf. subviscida]